MRVVIDSDGGIDDAAAITWLCSQPTIELAAITAVGGNVAVGHAARNLRIILEAAGHPEVEVYLGADPTAPAPHILRPVFIHGEDGLGDVGLADPRRAALGGGVVGDRTAAVDVLCREMARGSVVLTLGPLTNLAAALRAAPDSARTSRVVLMGGSARALGNARPTAEANVANDPSAAATVLSAVWAVPPVMVGLDVTHTATLRETEFAALARRRTAAAAFLVDPLLFYRRNAGSLCAPGETPCHDLLAAMVLVHPDMLGTEVLPVEVDTAGGPAWGQTVVDLRELTWRRRTAPRVDPAGAAGLVGAAGPVEAAGLVEAPGLVEAGEVGEVVGVAGVAGAAAAAAVTHVGADGNIVPGGAPISVALEVDVDFFRTQVRMLAGENGRAG